MGNNSILISKPNYFYQTTADEHLLICLPIQHKKEKSRSNPFCMAKLLSTIAFWTDKRRGPDNENQDLGVFFTLDQWHILLRGEHARQAIIDSLDAMVQEGFLTLRKEFRVGGGKPRNIYYLQAELVNSRILALPDIDPFDIFPKVPFNAQTIVTNGTTEEKTIVTNGTNVSNKRDYCKSQMGLLEVTNGTTNLNYKSITNNHITNNHSNITAERSARPSEPTQKGQKGVSQSSFLPSEESKPEPEGNKRGKGKGNGKKEVEVKPLTLPDLDQLATLETILQIATFYRSGKKELTVSKRSDSLYVKVQEAAEQLLNQPRDNGQKGFTLREINAVFCFLKCKTPEDKPWLKDEWWSDKSVDLHNVAKHIESKLAAMEKLERQHVKPGAPAPAGQGNNPFQTGDWSNAPTVIGGRYGKLAEEKRLVFDYDHEAINAPIAPGADRIRKDEDFVFWVDLPADHPTVKRYIECMEDLSIPESEYQAVCLQMPWRWMTPVEALLCENGWHDMLRFDDMNMQKLLNLLERETGVRHPHYIQYVISQSWVQEEYERIKAERAAEVA